MKIAIISDIHANFIALNAVADVLNQADKVLCLGDFVGYYCQVNEVIEYVRKLDTICILGNHDYFLINSLPKNANNSVRFGVEYADKVITSDNKRWLKSLPLIWGGVFDRCSFLLMHGSPWDPIKDYLYADSHFLNELEKFSYDVVAFSQTHRVWLREEKRPLLLNPGSVGQPRDKEACASALVFDTLTMSVEKIEKPFDPNKVIENAKDNGAGDWIAKHLIRK